MAGVIRSMGWGSLEAVSYLAQVFGEPVHSVDQLAFSPWVLEVPEAQHYESFIQIHYSCLLRILRLSRA